MRYVPLIAVLAACAPEDTGPQEVVIVEGPADPPQWPEAWEYSSFCWYFNDDGCKYNDGSLAGEERLDCIGEDDDYGCVVDGLNELGADAWRIELGDVAFPDVHRVYLLYRPLD